MVTSKRGGVKKATTVPPSKVDIKTSAMRPAAHAKGSTDIPPETVAAIVQGVTDQIRGMAQSGDWFGPLQPMRPIAQEVQGRLLDFPTGYNLRQSPRQEEAISFAQLRSLSENCDVLRIVLETRKDQVESLAWDIKSKDGKAVGEDVVNSVRLFFMQPSNDPITGGWSTWCRAMLEDLLVLDAVAIYPRMTFGGDVLSFDLIDASTIVRKIDQFGRTPLPPDPAYQQQLHGVPAANYSSDQLVYFVRNPRTHKLYGYSPVEQIVVTINTAIRKSLHQLQYFTEGNIPEALAGVPDTWNMDQIREFQLYWDSLMEGDTAMRRHMRFIPLDPQKIKETKPPELKDMYDEWIARIVCYAFSVAPTPFVKEQNRATAQTIAESAKIEGLLPFLHFLKWRFDYLINKYLKQPDLEFHWDLDEDVDPKTQADIDDIYVKMHALSPDEVRKDRFGREPMTPEEKESAWPTPEPLAGKLDKDGKPIIPPKGQQPPSDDNKQQQLPPGIGKLVIAPVIHLPERQVSVGDVNVTLQMPDDTTITKVSQPTTMKE